jgi:hypothetical protein
LKETIDYVKKKQKYNHPYKIHNIHCWSIHKNEEMKNPERLGKYWLTINNRNNYIKLKNKNCIEKKIKQLENKIDKFKI